MERKARSTMSKKNNLDLTKPLPLNIIGSDDDPCFGELNDPTAKECMRCGDCEICAIVQSQKQHGKRKKIESEKEFRDISEKKVALKKKKKK